MSKYNISKLFSFCRVKIEKIIAVHEFLTIVKIVPDYRFLPICSGCKRKVKHVHSYHSRLIRDHNMSGSTVIIHLTYRTVCCDHCGLKVEHHDFVEPYSRVTNRFAYFVYQLCEELTISKVAEYTGLSWDQVRKIDKDQIHKRYLPISLDDLKIICIDEISIKKHHKYLTVIANYLTGQVIEIVKNRDNQSLANYLKTLPKSVLGNIEAIAMDMWDPYIKAFKEYCPKAHIVFDRFHVVAALSRVIDKIRAQQYRLADEGLKAIMKKSRYILLKNPQNLTEHERPKLKTILQHNKLLASVYILKEYLKRLWQYKYQKSAQKFLDYWCYLALQTGNEYLAKFVNMIKRYRYGLINHCKYKIHTSKLEGINNKIKLIKRKAYGYRNLYYFKLKIIQATTK